MNARTPKTCEFYFAVMEPRTGEMKFYRNLPERVAGKVLRITGNADAAPIEVPGELTRQQFLAWEKRIQALGYRLRWIGI